MKTKPGLNEQILTAVAVGLLLLGCFVVLRPFLSALLWAVILSFATWPVFRRLQTLLGQRRSLAAAIMTLSIAAIFLVPFLVIAVSLADDVAVLAARIRQAFDAGPPAPPDWLGSIPLVGTSARIYWQSLAGDSTQTLSELKRFIEPAASWLLFLGGQLARGVFELTISILVAFFLFRDGPSAAQRLTLAVERMAGPEATELLDLAGRTVRGVVYGVLGTALTQAVVAGIGFAIVRVPGAGLLTLLTFFLSVLPVGPPLIWIPVALWLFKTSGWGWGIFMLVWGLLVSSVDNVVKPLIISQGSQIPFLLILIGVLGGAAGFGFIGVFIGPTLLAVSFRLVEQWSASRNRRAASKIDT